MPVKRQNAFSRALKEAQVLAEPDAVPEPPLQVQPIPSQVQPTPPAAPSPASESSSPLEVEPARNRGGRPRNVVLKKKFTYYLDSTSDDTITAIKKALVRHADVLLDDKGTVVEQALAMMRFGLEDPESRATFLALYDRWGMASKHE